MGLNKLYYVYGLDTACFYNDEEHLLESKILKIRHLKTLIKERYEKAKKKGAVDLIKKKTQHQISFINQYINKYKTKLKNLLHTNIDTARIVRSDKILNKEGEPAIRKRVSIFDSCLTRCFGLKEREFNNEIVIVKVYFFDVAESIVKHGFYMNGEKYVFFSASAGQIRTKKLVAVKEALLNKHWNTLTAGLTIESINAQGGMNINKFLAYLSLCNSATDLWGEFDIDKSIVVEDFENIVNNDVDFIDEKTYKITRQNMNVEITQSDGCGMILPNISDRNFMVRLPFVKGLLAKFDFRQFIIEKKGNPIVTDIYGKEHNIIEENITVIFTKSQFKMWKYFKDWEEYKDNFKKYNCSAGKCNIEEDMFPDSVINYQMIQTLSDMTDEELAELSKKNNADIINIATDMNTMLKMLNATEWNAHKNGFEKSLLKYPELLADFHSRQTVRDKKVSLEKDLWSARFNMGGKYTFVIPDLYAFCEWLFLGIKNPNGLLQNGEVCCKLYKNDVKLDCLRSPHLYREHPIRLNKTNIKWFDTKAIYISCHDMISKIVMCDWDGDKLLVSDNPTLVKVAERNMKGIYPLFYNMSKAKAEQLTPATLFKGLLLAYNGGNIGSPSNDITKIWNSGVITQEQLDIVKWLVMEVNFTIDYAKTLYKPERPEWVNNIIMNYIKAKTPYFFQFAKDKKPEQVEKMSECVVDRISSLFPTKQLSFKFNQSNIGKFDYKVLLNNKDIKVDVDVIKKYKKITSSLNFNKLKDETLYNYLATYEDAKNKILDNGYSKEDSIDMIVIALFYNSKSAKKTAFWTLFGEEVYINICKNLSDNCVLCSRCHKRFYKEVHNQKFCSKCKGYEKQNKKTIICQDCGVEFEVEGNSKTTRCPPCYKTYRQKRKNECKRVKRQMESRD